MKCFTGPEGKASFLGARGPELPVIIDVLRATSTIIVLLSRGAERVIPVEDDAEALKLGAELGALTIGERQGRKVQGFHHGNSPSEFLDADLSGQTVVITTSNGTRVMVEGGVIASTLNAGAVAGRIRSEPHAYMLASGAPLKSDEDLCCALLIEYIAGKIKAGETADSAVRLARETREGRLLLDGIRTSASGRKLTAFGFGRDVDLICTAVNTYPIVPVYRDGAIILE